MESFNCYIYQFCVLQMLNYYTFFLSINDADNPK